jgi:protein-tyrosine-phosphatase
VSVPVVFQLAGHPLRWRLLRQLTTSDRRVRELIDALEESQPLVSYHLRQLREAGLVTAQRSSFDGRDSYYSLDLDRYSKLLADAGTALHPALQATAQSAPTSRRRSRQARVLFLCTGNSSRSQIAEALLRELSAGTVDVVSAGSKPKPIHANAVAVMRSRGIDIASQQPRQLDVFARRRFDYVITLCDRVREVCPQFPGEPQTIHWSIPDPAAEPGSDEETYPAFEHAAAELETRIRFLLHQIRDTEGVPA